MGGRLPVPAEMSIQRGLASREIQLVAGQRDLRRPIKIAANTTPAAHVPTTVRIEPRYVCAIANPGSVPKFETVAPMAAMRATFTPVSVTAVAATATPVLQGDS